MESEACQKRAPRDVRQEHAVYNEDDSEQTAAAIWKLAIVIFTDASVIAFYIASKGLLAYLPFQSVFNVQPHAGRSSSSTITIRAIVFPRCFIVRELWESRNGVGWGWPEWGGIKNGKIKLVIS